MKSIPLILLSSLLMTSIAGAQANALVVTKVKAQSACEYRQGWYNYNNNSIVDFGTGLVDKYRHSFSFEYVYDQAGDATDASQATYGLFTALTGRQNLEQLKITDVDFDPRYQLLPTYKISNVTALPPTTMNSFTFEGRNSHTFYQDSFSLETGLGSMKMTFDVAKNIYTVGTTTRQFVTLAATIQGKTRSMTFICVDKGNKWGNSDLLDNNQWKTKQSNYEALNGPGSGPF